MNASTSKTFSHHNSFALSNKFREKETETTAVFESSMTVRITRNTSCGSRELLLRNDRNSACHLCEFCVTNYFSFLCFLFFFYLRIYAYTMRAHLNVLYRSTLALQKSLSFFFFYLMLLQIISYFFSVSACRYNIITLSLSFVDLYTL